jgi:hypothetical protein
MLMEPASNVSVPLTLVMRTAVSTAPNATLPPPLFEYEVPFAPEWFATHVFPVMFEITIVPENADAALF